MKGKMQCLRCGEEIDPEVGEPRCPYCGGILIPRKVGERVSRGPGIFKFSEFFATPVKSPVSLEEGNTPMMLLERLSKETGVKIYFKDERRNPTGTFIDRGAALSVSFAKMKGIKRIRVASIGDLGISMAAYTRRAQIFCHVFMPRSSPPSKVYQTDLLADKLELLDGYSECLRESSKTKSKYTFPINPSNPYLLDGYRSIFVEIFLSSKEDFDAILLPIGDGALITAIYSAMLDLGRMIPIIGVRSKEEERRLSEISVRRPLLAEGIKEAIEHTGGEVFMAEKRDIQEATTALARSEGILMDFSGSSVLSPIIAGKVGGKVICVGTGAPLKDASAIRSLIGGKSVGMLGETKRRILELLGAYGELHPYVIWRMLREKYEIEISLRAVYSHMYDLERERYVLKTIKGRRTKYSLTEKGFEALERGHF